MSDAKKAPCARVPGRRRDRGRSAPPTRKARRGDERACAAIRTLHKCDCGCGHNMFWPVAQQKSIIFLLTGRGTVPNAGAPGGISRFPHTPYASIRTDDAQHVPARLNCTSRAVNNEEKRGRCRGSPAPRGRRADDVVCSGPFARCRRDLFRGALARGESFGLVVAPRPGRNEIASRVRLLAQSCLPRPAPARSL